MKARDIMTTEPRVVMPGDTIRQAAGIMRDSDVGMVPVVEDEQSMTLRGVITDRDIAVRHVAEGHGNDCTVSEDMSGDVVTVGPDDDLDRVMNRMRRNQVRRIPVVEDGRRLVGVIAQADLAVDTGPDAAEDVEGTVEEISLPAEPRR